MTSYRQQLAQAIKLATFDARACKCIAGVERINGKLKSVLQSRNPIIIVNMFGDVKVIETPWTKLLDERKALAAERRECEAWVERNLRSEEFSPYDKWVASFEAEAALRRAEQIDKLIQAIDARLRGHYDAPTHTWQGLTCDEWLSHRAEVEATTEDEIFARAWPDLKAEDYDWSDIPACLDAEQREFARREMKAS